jgi:thymidylate synthase
MELIPIICAELAQLSTNLDDQKRDPSEDEKQVPLNTDQFHNSQNYDESEYLALVERVIRFGESRDDRTGVGTFSKFGPQLRFDLTNGKVPVLTTKKVWWRAVVEELLWFISGSTNEEKLSSKGVHIWKANRRKGMDGDLGPTYGFQWRHSGAEYFDCHTDYSGKGVDQLAWVINEIQTNPNSRRLVVSAWNPKDLPGMALPPCHMSFQFYVHSGTNNSQGELSCHVYQRSADLGLGVPFNIASYGLLTHLVAEVCKLKAKELIMTFGDAHVYKTHIAGLARQISRTPLPSPTVTINPRECIDDFTAGDIKLVGYKSHDAISFEMAV